MEQVCQAMRAMTQAHTGNYLACFPSHAYLEQAYRYYRMRFPQDRAIRQEAHMSEDARSEFIAAFENAPKESMLAFIVLGGVFAEGVDLPEERLSGAAIVSTGIPQPNPESELLRELYDDGFEGGTDAAYTYPGYRRVLPAAGRGAADRPEVCRGKISGACAAALAGSQNGKHERAERTSAQFLEGIKDGEEEGKTDQRTLS